jgi:hypothetical protein
MKKFKLLLACIVFLTAVSAVFLVVNSLYVQITCGYGVETPTVDEKVLSSCKEATWLSAVAEALSKSPNSSVKQK